MSQGNILCSKKQLSLDLGFNRDSLPAPNNLDRPPLFSGVTVVDVVGNPIRTVRQICILDSLNIGFYDLMPNADHTDIEELSFQLRFTSARSEQNRSSPLAKIVYDQFLIRPGKQPKGESTVFPPGEYPAWFASRSAGAAKYPDNQLDAGESSEPGPVFDNFDHVGFFYFSMTLQVKPVGQPRIIFQSDPEMVVTNNGTTPTYDG